MYGKQPLFKTWLYKRNSGASNTCMPHLIASFEMSPSYIVLPIFNDADDCNNSVLHIGTLITSFSIATFSIIERLDFT